LSHRMRERAVQTGGRQQQSDEREGADQHRLEAWRDLGPLRRGRPWSTGFPE
jgi:hypothetical protein